jgi:hypothetical protein
LVEGRAAGQVPDQVDSPAFLVELDLAFQQVYLVVTQY